MGLLMAAKKNNSDAPMTEKVQVQGKKSGTMSKFVGYALLSLGAILLITGIVLIVLYRSAPKLDEDMDRPTLDRIVSSTNDEEIKLKGEVKDEKYVMLFVNDEVEENRLKVEDEEFEYTYEFPDEGEYVFEVASVKGFPVRKRSEKSRSQKVDVDWTAPSSLLKLDYDEEVEDGVFSVKGEAEEDTTVLLEKDGKVYSSVADKDGEFEIKDIPLDEGDNEFDVTLKDDAGNKREVSKKVEVSSTVAASDGDVNGDGVTDAEDLPEAAGELEAAMDFLMGNKLMTSFGLVALFVLVLNSGLVLNRFRKESA